MSKALICDRCKKPFMEQAALHMEAKRKFIITHYDLCPECHTAFKEEFLNLGEKKEVKSEQ